MLIGRRMAAWMAVAIACGWGIAGAQDQGGPTGTAEQEMMQEYLKMMMPGEGHKRLEPWVGKWNYTQKMYPGGPGTEPMATQGTAEAKWILNGRFLQQTWSGEMMGQKVDGFGLIGYDNWRNMYVASWANGLSTALLTATGSADQTGNVITFYGTMDEPTLKITGRMVEYIYTMRGPDTLTLELVDLHAAHNYKVIEIEFTRAQ